MEHFTIGAQSASLGRVGLGKNLVIYPAYECGHAFQGVAEGLPPIFEKMYEESKVDVFIGLPEDGAAHVIHEIGPEIDE
jgi:hypothetical protein